MTEVSRKLSVLREMGWTITVELLLDGRVSISGKRPDGGGFYFVCHKSDALEKLADAAPEAFSGTPGHS